MFGWREVTITKHGREVARLVPVNPNTARPADVTAALLEAAWDDCMD